MGKADYTVHSLLHFFSPFLSFQHGMNPLLYPETKHGSLRNPSRRPAMSMLPRL